MCLTLKVGVVHCMYMYMSWSAHVHVHNYVIIFRACVHMQVQVSHVQVMLVLECASVYYNIIMDFFVTCPCVPNLIV